MPTTARFATLFVAAATSLSIAGCGSKPDLGCSTPEAKELVVSLATDAQKKLDPTGVVDWSKSKLSVEDARTTESTEHKTRCEADVHALTVLSESAKKEFSESSSKEQLNQIKRMKFGVSYEITATDEGKLYVKLTDMDQNTVNEN